MSQYKKETIEIRILKAAKTIFLKQGYLKASLRSISDRAKVTLSNLYNYYSDKNALFLAVLKPQLDAMEKLCEYGRAYQFKGDPFETLQDKQRNMHIALDYIDKHRRELNLLFNLSTGSSLENYSNYLAKEYEKNWERFFENLHKAYPQKKFKKPSIFFLRNMANFHIMTVSKIITHNLSRDEIIKLSEEIATFFWHGGMGLLNNTK